MFDARHHTTAETPAVVMVALPPADPAGMNSLAAVPPPDRGGVSSPPALPPADPSGVSIRSPMVMMSTKRTAVDAMPPVGGVVLDVFVMKV